MSATVNSIIAIRARPAAQASTPFTRWLNFSSDRMGGSAAQGAADRGDCQGHSTHARSLLHELVTQLARPREVLRRRKALGRHLLDPLVLHRLELRVPRGALLRRHRHDLQLVLLLRPLERTADVLLVVVLAGPDGHLGAEL